MEAKKALGYIRLKEQPNELDVAIPRLNMERFMADYHFENIGIIEDYSQQKYPVQLNRILQQLGSGDYDAVIVNSLNRLSRDIETISRIIELFAAKYVELYDMSSGIELSRDPAMLAALKSMSNMMGKDTMRHKEW